MPHPGGAHYSIQSISMKRIGSVIFLLFAIVGSGRVFSQNSTPMFNGIHVEGQVPADLRKSLEELYMEDKQRVRDYSDGKLPNRDKVLTSSYYINRLMASGKILYGDPITQMLNRIADTLLAGYPDLRSELRIYSVKSTEVNAFTTGQGMIFVNLGLVAQVEDEAQLAFVLSHEIVHYLRKHSLESITRKQSTKDTTGEQLNRFLRYHSRSHQMENEADSIGIAMFYANSPYDKRVTEGFFDVLQYGYLPFDEVTFDTTMYNTEHFKLSNGSFLESVDPISARDDYNDSLSTHPNLLKRRTATSRQMSSMSGGKKYVVTDKNRFRDLQTLARMQCIRQDLTIAEYASAYYNCYVMLRQQPDNKYLRLAQAQALYGAAKYRNYAAASSVSDYRNKEGEVQQAYHFMRKSNANELCITAIREIWKAHLQMPDEPRLTAMATDLMSDLSKRYKFKPDQFSATLDTAKTEESSSREENNKYSNVKRRRNQQKRQESLRYAFMDLMQKDPTFESTLKEAMQNNKEEKKSIGQGKSFVYAPTYYVFNESSGELKIRKSDNGERTLTEDVKAVNAKNGIGTVDFSDEAMRSHSDAKFYNDFLTMNEWANEYWQSRGKVPMIFCSQPEMDEMNQRYGTDKLSLETVLNAENCKNHIFQSGAFSLLLFAVALPESIYSLLTANQTTAIQTTLVDTRDGSTLSNSNALMYRDDTRANVRSQAYATLNKSLHPGKVPGYMGKKLIVEGSAGLSFPFLNHIFRDKTDDIAWRIGGGLEYTIGEQSSLSLNADWGNTTFDIPHENGTTQAKIMMANLTYRRYFGDNIAPQGPYFGIGAGVSRLNLKANSGTGLACLKSEYTKPSLQLEFGHNTIISDFIVLNFGVKYNATIANPVNSIGYEPWDTASTNRTDAERSMNANLWIYNLISLHIGIGLLPF